jgi:hypothetical protein
MDLDRVTVAKRLETLYGDLEAVPPDASVSWSVGRIFNELLKQVRRELPEDPVVSAISVLPKQPDAEDRDQVQVATVRAVIGQLVAALSDATAAPKAQPRSAARAKG